MNTESFPFNCPAALDALRQRIAAADAFVAQIERYVANAATARTEAAAAEARFTKTLDDSDAVEFVRLDELAEVAESLARAAVSIGASQRRHALLDVAGNFQLVAEAATARAAALRAIVKTSRAQLAGLVAEEALQGYELQRRNRIERVRFEVNNLENHRQDAEFAASAARQRVAWIEEGRNPMQTVPQHERTIDGFVATLSAPLPEAVQAAPAQAIAVEIVTDAEVPATPTPTTSAATPDENHEV